MRFANRPINQTVRTLLAISVSAASSNALAQCDPSMLFPQSNPTSGVGITPFSVAIGDLNNDGVPDLAVANQSTNDVSVLLGNGDGSFQAKQRFSIGTGSFFVVIGNLNDDEIPDLVVANAFSSDVSVLLGIGDGSFQNEQRYHTGNFSTSVAIGDLDGDGIPDLAVANRNSDDVSILLGIGDGTFQSEQRYAAGDGAFSVAMDDLNGDGVLDLAVANFLLSSTDVSVLLGNGDGSFQKAQIFTAGLAPYAVAIGDLNGDGTPDLAVANRTESDVSILLGIGDGTFQTQQRFGTGSAPVSVAIDDIDGDGTPDLAVANSFSDDVSILLGTGDGSFPNEQRFGGGESPGSVAIHDLDGNGTPDLAVTNYFSDDISILLNQCPATAPCPGDCDNSGAIDFNDLIAMLFEFGNPTIACDTDASGVVDFNDLVAALFLFGPCPSAMFDRLVVTCALGASVLSAPHALAGEPSKGHGEIGGCEGCETVVFDLSSFTPDTVAGEIIGAHAIEGEVVDAFLEIVLVVDDPNVWTFDGSFTFNGRSYGFSSFEQGWSGIGTFSFAQHDDSLNGFIGTPDGQGLAAWFFNWQGGAFIESHGGSGVFPLDARFPTLRLTLTLAAPPFCPGDCDGSRTIDFNDLIATLFEFGDESGGVCDSDASGLVDFNDLVATLFLFGPCPGPLDV
ncbi:unnamed protein product [Symbiodinium necroappetens]|uniref:Uncharacterized protein n=1 Tax=Symbiodinium necroappetens TaxID=1628268 RepID=A0A812XVW3_9DINO|nr:unnamed protein product [Symbiodinium necroappetens]